MSNSKASNNTQQVFDNVNDNLSIREFQVHNFALKELLESKIESMAAAIKNEADERDRLYNERNISAKVAVDAALTAAKSAVDAALIAQDKLTTAAFASAEKAITKAEDAQKEYNIRSNEFRGQLDDQAKALMPRAETIALLKAGDEKVYAQFSGIVKQIENQRDDIVKLREYRSGTVGKESATEINKHDQQFDIKSILSIIAIFVSIATAFIVIWKH
jgi:hypothetical protein